MANKLRNSLRKDIFETPIRRQIRMKGIPVSKPIFADMSQYLYGQLIRIRNDASGIQIGKRVEK